MVLCRNQAPLLKLCLEFLHEGTKAYVKGQDLGEDLIGHEFLRFVPFLFIPL
mgnify:CR=1 FL=1